MQKTIECEIEEVLKEVFSAFGKNLKYEKDRIRTYCKYLLRNYETLDFRHFEEVCEVLILSRNFLPTVNEIIDCYDFLLWCKEDGRDKEERVSCYRDYISKEASDIKTYYGIFKRHGRFSVGDGIIV